MRLLPFGNRSIQPPGKSSSIRPPRSGQSTPTSIRPPSTPSTDGPPSDAHHESDTTGLNQPEHTPTTLTGNAQASKPRHAVGLWLAVLLGATCVAALVMVGRVAVNTTSHVAPSASPPPPPPPPPASCEMEGHQTEDSSWKETWSLDTGLPAWENDFTWDTYSCGHYIVVIHHKNDDKTDLMGFHIEGNKLKKIWSTSLGYTFTTGYRHWWGGHLLLDDEVLDPTTGKTTELPPGFQSSSFVANDNIAVSCSSSYSDGSSTCAGWDWNDGEPTQRWQQTYEFTSVYPLWHHADGTPTSDSIAVSVESTPKDSSRIGVLSTRDGSLLTLSPEKNDQGRPIQLLSARDGWVTIDPDSSTASTFSENGAPAESFTLKGSTASLLIKDGQQPTLSQFKAAYESGDTSWADIDLTCSDATHCSLNGTPLTLSDEVAMWNTPARAQFQSSWKLSSDKRTLTIRGRSASSEIGAVFMIDTTSKTPMDPLPITSRGAVIPVWRQNLIVAIDGSTLVGYAP